MAGEKGFSPFLKILPSYQPYLNMKVDFFFPDNIHVIIRPLNV